MTNFQSALRRASRAARFSSLLGLTLTGPALAFERVDSIAPPIGAVEGFQGAVSATFGYDSNRLVVADAPIFFPAAGKQDAVELILNFRGVYETRMSDRFSFGAMLDVTGDKVFGSQPAGVPPGTDDPSAYSQVTATPGIFARFSGQTAGGRWEILPSYSYRWEGESSVAALGLRSHQVRLDARFFSNSGFSVLSYALYQDNDFSVVFPAASRDRDGQYTEVGVSVQTAVMNGRALVTAGVAYQDNNANGLDWRYDGAQLSLGIAGLITGNIVGSLGYTYTQRSYETGFTDLVAAGRTGAHINEVTAEIRYLLDAASSVALVASHSDVGANNPAFSSSGSRIGINYRRRF